MLQPRGEVRLAKGLFGNSPNGTVAVIAKRVSLAKAQADASLVRRSWVESACCALMTLLS